MSEHGAPALTVPNPYLQAVQRHGDIQGSACMWDKLCSRHQGSQCISPVQRCCKGRLIRQLAACLAAAQALREGHLPTKQVQVLRGQDKGHGPRSPDCGPCLVL